MKNKYKKRRLFDEDISSLIKEEYDKIKKIMQTKLTQIWIQKMKDGDVLNITDLYQFSKVSLKRKRIRKKFHKHYERYVSKEVYETYWGCLIANPIYNSFKEMTKFLDIKPLESISSPNVELIYPDFKYQEGDANT